MEAYGESDRYYFPMNFKFSHFLYRAALKFSFTPLPSFTKAATGASEKLGGQSQKTEVGEPNKVAECGWTDNEGKSKPHLYTQQSKVILIYLAKQDVIA